MKSSPLYALLTALSLVAAQTPSGFPVSVSESLKVIYGNISITNGQQLPRSTVQSPPNISTPVFSQTGRAVLLMVDLDVPANSTSRVNLLHWLAPDITGTTSGTNTSLLSLPPSSEGVPYLQPSPPQGDYPHRYVFTLWEQPRNFSIPANVQAAATNTSLRRGFDINAFLRDSGLVTPLAGNYILVANNSGTASTTFPPAAFTATSTLVAGSTATGSVTGSATTEGGSSATGSGSASASGSAATASSTSAASGAVLRSGSGVGLLAVVFGMLLL